MPESFAWEDIATPDSDFNVRLLGRYGQIQSYYGKDSQKRLAMLIELPGIHDRQFFAGKPNLRGIALELRSHGDRDDVQRLVLTLQNSLNRDIFTTLCKSVFSRIQDIENPEMALETVLRHLARWQAFLACKTTTLLEPARYRGLFGELVFLQSLLESRNKDLNTINAWVGCENGAQDFVFLDRAVEIKTLSGTARNRVTISSEDQLATLLPRLYLVCIALIEAPESGLSLNGLVEKIYALLAGNESRARFDNKLAEYGYLPLPEYDRPRLEIGDIRAYKVASNFPRLTRANVPAGITNVRYLINLENLEEFLCGYCEATGGQNDN